MKSRLGTSLLVLMFTMGVAQAEIVQFTTTIDGAQANSCAGTGSPGTGSGTLVLDTVTGQVDYNIEFSGLAGTETAAHVHGAAAACTPAGIVYGLPAGSPKIGSTTLTAGQVNDMLAGLHYVNIHSTTAPGGEIRGQVLQVGGIPTVSEWGIAIMALILLAVGSIVFIWNRKAVTA